MICDYFIIRKKILAVDDLYLRNGIYEYSGGFNWAAITALALGSVVALSGKILHMFGVEVQMLNSLYDYSWFVGFFIAFTFYYVAMRGSVKSPVQ